ncbi:MAG: hypothetical protein GEV00_21865 [Actinophytocola sp.]|nr:hypothetical protein [Actinophytocola sp.]
MAGQHRRPTDADGDYPELPPRPHPSTGKPFPPHAPAYNGRKTISERARSNRFFAEPTPPPGMGPVLAWRHDGIADKARDVAWWFGLSVVIGAAPSLLRGQGLHALTLWQIWMLILVGTFVMSRPLSLKSMSAGADWIQWCRRKRWYHRCAHQGWLKTYELVSIKGFTRIGMLTYLRLEDADGRVLKRMKHDLQPNRQIWDLLYNGILHSVANGAVIDNLANGILKLDEAVVELRLKHYADTQNQDE